MPRCTQLLAKHPQHPLRILPEVLHLPHQYTVTAKWVPAQLIDILHKASPNRVEVNVAYQFQEVDILLTQNGFKAVLEYMVPLQAGSEAAA
jgi:hypothetical protein